MKNILLTSALFFLGLNVHASCREYPSGFGGKVVRCDDGNTYNIQKNELTDTTTIRGSNPYTSSQWSTEIRGNDSLLGPSMRGTDKDRNNFNCRINSFTNKWDCR